MGIVIPRPMTHDSCPLPFIYMTQRNTHAHDPWCSYYIKLLPNDNHHPDLTTLFNSTPNSVFSRQPSSISSRKQKGKPLLEKFGEAVWTEFQAIWQLAWKLRYRASAVVGYKGVGENTNLGRERGCWVEGKPSSAISYPGVNSLLPLLCLCTCPSSYRFWLRK